MDQVEYLEPSLAEVIERVGTLYLSVVAAPLGLDVPVSGPAIHDPARPVAPKSGSVVLLVGVAPGDAAAAVESLHGAAAAVLRTEPGTPSTRLSAGAGPDAAAELVSAAERAGVAVLALPGAMTWSHLHTLLEDAVLLGDSLVAPPSPDLGSAPVGDLNALVNAVAETLDRPAAILDTQWRLLAYSAVPGQVIDELQREVILNKTVPARSAPPETRRLLLTSERALRFFTGEPYDREGSRIWRLGVGIRGGPEPLGMMWILEGDEQLSGDRVSLAEEFARLAGAHLLRLRTARTADRERRGELAGQALDGRDAPAACRRLGLDPAAPLAVMAVACVDAPGEHLLDDVAGYLDAYRRTAACVLRGDTVYCLMPAQDMAALGEVAAQLTVRLGLRRRLLAGVGSRVGAEELATSRRHADLVLSVLRGSGGAVGASATIDDVRATAALVELRSLLDDQPQLLVHRDVVEGAGEWVLAWIESHGDVRAAAVRLGVHPNTLRYRVRRLAEAGLDLADPDTRLVTWLRLRAGSAPGRG